MSPARCVDAAGVRQRLSSLAHRGPDDLGVLILSGSEVRLTRRIDRDFEADVLLEHRRLSILDLSEAGWQPMGTADGSYYLVFNGEIYNHVELREELERAGFRFRSRTDTEVLLLGYVRWGDRVLERLVGMFAFAILDVRRRSLLLARDPFGIKPLFYARWTGGLAFASELNPLLSLPGVSRRSNPARVYDFLRFGITDVDGETLFRDVRQLPAGHLMEVSVDNPLAAEPARYWEISPPISCDLGFEEAAHHLRELFVRSVELHLRSDVPVGAALSGGIDSSSICGAIRYLRPNAELHTFSYLADDPKLSEERWAESAARSARAVSHKVDADPSRFAAELDSVIESQGECFGGTSIYAQREVFRKAADEGIRVVLDGQGADEILGGYYPYLGARLGSMLRAGRYREAARFARRAGRRIGVNPLGILARAMDFVLPTGIQIPLRRLLGRDLDPPWLNAAWFQEQGVLPYSVGYTKRPDVLRSVLENDLVRTRLPRLLRFADRNAMAFSIENRVPFLTPELLAFTRSLPEKYLVADDGTTKAVFRCAMRGLVPDEILNRTDKIAFETPERRWIAGLQDWIATILDSDTARANQAFRIERLLAHWKAIVHGHRTLDQQVWRWVTFVRWSHIWEIQTS